MSNDAEWKVYQKEIFHEFDGNCYWNSAHQFTFHDAITAVLEFIPFTMKFLSIFFSPQIGSELTFSEPIECIFWLCLFFFHFGNRVWHNNEMSKWMNACDLTWIDNEFIDINVMFGFVHFYIEIVTLKFSFCRHFEPSGITMRSNAFIKSQIRFDDKKRLLKKWRKTTK